MSKRIEIHFFDELREELRITKIRITIIVIWHLYRFVFENLTIIFNETNTKTKGKHKNTHQKNNQKHNKTIKNKNHPIKNRGND